MRIQGLRILDSNFYHQITICDGLMVVQRRDKRGNLVNKDDEVKRVRSENPISKEIKKLDDFEAIDRTVEYYLDYNKITGIDDIEMNGKKYVIIESPDDKRLRFRITPSNVTIMRVINKYHQDREKFLMDLTDNSLEFEFEIGFSHTFYEKGKDSFGGDRGKFSLGCEKAGAGGSAVRKSELEFFGKAISFIMSGRIAMVDTYEQIERFGFIKKEHMIVDSEFSEKRIIIPRELIPAAEMFVSEHNQKVWSERREQEKIEGKVYQMKMEEF